MWCPFRVVPVTGCDFFTIFAWGVVCFAFLSLFRYDNDEINGAFEDLLAEASARGMPVATAQVRNTPPMIAAYNKLAAPNQVVMLAPESSGRQLSDPERFPLLLRPCTSDMAAAFATQKLLAE